MKNVDVEFEIPEWISSGLKSNAYERFGGVIRNSQTKEVIAWLREASPNLIQAGTLLTGIGSVASILTLGVSVIGFAVVIHRLGKIEQRIKKLQEDVNALHNKFDLSVYANFRAALDLARNAFTMSKPENRLSMANLAINRFLEAQPIYLNYTEVAIEKDIQVAHEYLYSLLLSYVAEARCYLEIEEFETAKLRLQENLAIIKPCVKKYINQVSSTYPELNGKIEQENSLGEFVAIGGGALGTAAAAGVVVAAVGGAAIFAPLLAIGASAAWIAGCLGTNAAYEGEKALYAAKQGLVVQNLKERCQEVVETLARFEMYAAEVQTMGELGFGFQDWCQLSLSKPNVKKSELIYLIPVS